MGSPLTPYFLCFHYFGPAVAHSCFSTSYIANGLLFLYFRAPLSPFISSRPICLSYGLVIHYSCSLGLMDFLSICQTLLCLCCWASSSYLGFQNDSQHLAPWTYEAFLQFIYEWKTFLPFLSFHFLFLRGFFEQWSLPCIYIYIFSYIYIYICVCVCVCVCVSQIVLSLRISQLSSCFETQPPFH